MPVLLSYSSLASSDKKLCSYSHQLGWAPRLWVVAVGVPDPVAALDHGVDRGEQVERNGDGVQVVVVVDPRRRPGEFPLHVRVLLDPGEGRCHQRDQQVQHDENHKYLDGEDDATIMICISKGRQAYNIPGRMPRRRCQTCEKACHPGPLATAQ